MASNLTPPASNTIAVIGPQDANAAVIRTWGELILAAIILVGGGVLLYVIPNSEGILTLVASSIGAIVGFYFGGKRGGQGGY